VPCASACATTAPAPSPLSKQYDLTGYLPSHGYMQTITAARIASLMWSPQAFATSGLFGSQRNGI
jgi:hypothetical protein